MGILRAVEELKNECFGLSCFRDHHVHLEIIAKRQAVRVNNFVGFVKLRKLEVCLFVCVLVKQLMNVIMLVSKLGVLHNPVVAITCVPLVLVNGTVVF